jgi:hypothetical protein
MNSVLFPFSSCWYILMVLICLQGGSAGKVPQYLAVWQFLYVSIAVSSLLCFLVTLLLFCDLSAFAMSASLWFQFGKVHSWCLADYRYVWEYLFRPCVPMFLTICTLVFGFLSITWLWPICNLSDIVTCMSNYRRGLSWWLDLLTTYRS